MFQEGIGKECLSNVLKAYALLDPEVGYCQGMAFIVAMFLLYMDEESSFWMLYSLMHYYDHRNTYSSQMTKLKQIMYTINALLETHQPELWNYFVEVGVYSELYAPQWFMSFFIVPFPMSIALRLFDSYLYEGKKTLLRASIAFFKMVKPEIMGLNFVDAVEKIQQSGKNLEAEKFMKNVFKVRITHKGVAEIEKEFENNPREQLSSSF